MSMLIGFIEQYGLFAVFLNVLVESLGLPLPSYPVLIVAAALIPTHHYSAAGLVLVSVAASLIGDSVWFWSGRYIGPRIVGFLCRISLSPDSCVRQTSAITRGVGPSALSITKFFPGVGTMAIVLAGVLRTPLRTFLFFDTIGAVLYMTLAVALGVVFHNAVEDVLTVIARWGNWGLVALAALIGLYIFNKWWQRRQFIRQLRMDRITVSELHALIGGDSKPMILDAQTTESRSLYGTIPDAIIVDIHNLDSIPADLSATDEIIVYCACPNEASAVFVAKQLKKAGFKKIRPLLGGIEAWKQAGHLIQQEPKSHMR
jgi:membrane protein DedA with SNARE-associated domain/rhodanese-related sulfurtransferase